MADFKINSTSDLERMLKYIEKHMKFALEDVAKMVEEEIKDYVMRNLYNIDSPTAYTRTYDYINSLTVSKVKQNADGGYTVEIFFDTDKIMPQPPDGEGRWSRHSSITSYNGGGSGDDVSDMIPVWLEYGTNGGLFDRDGIYAMENTKKIMEETKYHLYEIKKILEKKGFKIEIV